MVLRGVQEGTVDREGRALEERELAEVGGIDSERGKGRKQEAKKEVRLVFHIARRKEEKKDTDRASPNSRSRRKDGSRAEGWNSELSAPPTRLLLKVLKLVVESGGLKDFFFDEEVTVEVTDP